MPWLPMRDGRALYVRTMGRGAPVMLVHGFASDGGSWLPFVAPFLHRYRFIMPDLRGAGRSHALAFSGPDVITQFAEDLHDVLAALRVERAPVVGISMGAFSLVRAFQLSGERFSRYLHLDQGPIINNRADYPHGLLGDRQADFFARVRALMDELEASHLERPWAALPLALRRTFWTLMGEFALHSFSHRPVRSLLQRAFSSDDLMQRVLPVTNWPVYTRVVRAYLDGGYDLSEAFRSIRAPVTVLIGGASRMYPPAGQRTIAQLVPHARVRELPGVGHMIPYEAPRTFLAELGKFLTG